jgi:Na+-transporting methylmalonyl-CoA/oxaloacetate decarboxylase gamma subunit
MIKRNRKVTVLCMTGAAICFLPLTIFIIALYTISRVLYTIIDESLQKAEK